MTDLSSLDRLLERFPEDVSSVKHCAIGYGALRSALVALREQHEALEAELVEAQG